jgi:hypothetical protein
MASDLVPGTCKTGTIDPAAAITISTGETLKPGYVSSVTQNPPNNVEAGLTQAKSATGCTLTYTVADSVASSVTLVVAGTGYEVLDTIKVADDLGVTVSVATIT